MPNRRSFEEDFQKEKNRSQRFEHTFAIAIIDVDRFKNVNDSFGHANGDLVLQQLATLLRDRARNIDLIARWGGEEFVVLLPETDLNGARAWAEDIRQSIENHAFTIENRQIRVTASFGLASYPNDNQDAERLFELADERLYQAKHNGRNCVVSG